MLNYPVRLQCTSSDVVFPFSELLLSLHFTLMIQITEKLFYFLGFFLWNILLKMLVNIFVLANAQQILAGVTSCLLGHRNCVCMSECVCERDRER